MFVVREIGQLGVDGDLQRRQIDVGLDHAQFGEELIDVELDLSDALAIVGHGGCHEEQSVGHLEEEGNVYRVLSVRLHIDGLQ